MAHPNLGELALDHVGHLRVDAILSLARLESSRRDKLNDLLGDRGKFEGIGLHLGLDEELLSHVCEESDSLFVVHVTCEDEKTDWVNDALKLLFGVLKDNRGHLFSNLRLRLKEDVNTLDELSLHALAGTEGHHLDSLATRCLRVLLKGSLYGLIILGVDCGLVFIVDSDVLSFQFLEEATAEVLVGCLFDNNLELSGLGDSDSVWLNQELDIADLLNSLDSVRGFAADVGVRDVALKEVFAVESELVFADDQLVSILLDVGEDDLGALEDVHDFPLVDKHVVDGGLRGANEDVLAAWIGNFFFLSHAEVYKLLLSLLEFLLDEDRAALNNVGVLTDHLEGKLELSSSWGEVFVSDLEVRVEGQWPVLEGAGGVQEHLVKHRSASPAVLLLLHGVVDLEADTVLHILLQHDGVIEAFQGA